MKNTALQNEWTLLQNQYDSYEKFSLVIKLVCLSLSSFLFYQDMAAFYLVVIIALFWLQDAIWKTFQSRIETRLLALESALEQANTEENSNTETSTNRHSNDKLQTLTAFQFNRDFAVNRPSAIALIFSYFTQAIRPTIAYPYVVMVALILLNMLVSN